MTEKTLPMKFGRCLRAEREHRGISIAQLAGLVGITYPAVVQLELGKTWPRASTLDKIKKALDVPLHRLMGEDPVQPDALNLARQFDRLSKGDRDLLKALMVRLAGPGSEPPTGRSSSINAPLQIRTIAHEPRWSEPWPTERDEQKVKIDTRRQ